MKKLKHKNKKTVIDEITFMSAGEATRYCNLKIMEKKGEIFKLRLQQPFTFACGVKYIADFTYYLRCNCEFINHICGDYIVEDFKGQKTPVYQIKKKMFMHEFVKTGEVQKFIESYKDGTIKEIKPPKAKKQ